VATGFGRSDAVVALVKSLNFPCTRFLMKLFCTGNNELITEVGVFFKFC